MTLGPLGALKLGAWIFYQRAEIALMGAMGERRCFTVTAEHGRVDW